MSRSRKRKLHRCKNHPRTVARGKCVACGAWVCNECAVLHNGMFLCADTCAGTSKRPRKPREESPGASKPVRPAPRGAGILVWASATLALSALAFGLRQSGTVRSLREENARLRMTRMELIQQIKQANREIAALRLPRDTVETAEAAPRLNERSSGNPRVVVPAPPPAPETVDGLPVSFDNGDVDKPLVCLTFDGGAHANAAPAILDTLNSRSVHATMFLTGRFMRRYPELVRRMVDAGHEIGNHTMNHPRLTSWARDRTHTTLPDVTREFLGRELRGAEEIFSRISGRDLAPIWRAPYGERNRRICIWARRWGYLHVGWRQGRTWRENLDSNDWVPDEETPGYHSPREVMEKIMTLAAVEPHGLNGGIVLMHLGTAREDPKEQVHRILGRLIDRLSGLGYRFVTATTMMKASGVRVDRIPSPAAAAAATTGSRG